MKRIIFLLLAMAFGSLNPAHAQNVTWPRENIIALTSDWKGERLPDGRPKVSDNLLERLKAISMEEAWAELRKNGYFN